MSIFSISRHRHRMQRSQRRGTGHNYQVERLNVQLFQGVDCSCFAAVSQNTGVDARVQGLRGLQGTREAGNFGDLGDGYACRRWLLRSNRGRPARRQPRAGRGELL